MKKSGILATIITGLFLSLVLCSFTTQNENNAQNNNPYVSTASTAAFIPITAYRISINRDGTYTIQRVSAEFDRNQMILRVVERYNGKNYPMDLNVTENPYKGYRNDPRSGYNYTAYAMDYYFD